MPFNEACSLGAGQMIRGATLWESTGRDRTKFAADSTQCLIRFTFDTAKRFRREIPNAERNFVEQFNVEIASDLCWREQSTQIRAHNTPRYSPSSEWALSRKSQISVRC